MSAREAGFVSVAALSHTGRVRPHNEDCIAVGTWLHAQSMRTPLLLGHALDHPLVCMVLDGMGGAAAGEVAARLCAEYLSVHLPACASEQALSVCVRAANAMLFEHMSADAETLGMGATFAGLRIAADGVIACNVGDCRVYRVQDGRLSQLSVDDVPPAAQAAAGRSGVVTQSLGGLIRFREIAPHVCSRSPAPGTYLLCSDGLYDGLDLAAMESAIDGDLGASVSRLFERAMDAGGRDNISIILLRLEAR